MLDIVEQLIGPDFLMWGSALFGKPAGGGKETPWHQDGEYWPLFLMRGVDRSGSNDFVRGKDVYELAGA